MYSLVKYFLFLRQQFQLIKYVNWMRNLYLWWTCSDVVSRPPWADLIRRLRYRTRRSRCPGRGTCCPALPRRHSSQTSSHLLLLPHRLKWVVLAKAFPFICLSDQITMITVQSEVHDRKMFITMTKLYIPVRRNKKYRSHLTHQQCWFINHYLSIQHYFKDLN